MLGSPFSRSRSAVIVEPIEIVVASHHGASAAMGRLLDSMIVRDDGDLFRRTGLADELLDQVVGHFLINGEPDRDSMMILLSLGVPRGGSGVEHNRHTMGFIAIAPGEQTEQLASR